MKKALLIAIVGLFLCFGEASATLYNFNVSEDAYVISAQLDTTYNGTDLVTWLAPTATYTTFLKFNLSSIPSNETITSATLSLYKHGGGGNSGTTAYYVADDSWSETSLTYRHKPAIGDSIGSNATTGSAASAWLNWSLTLAPLFPDGNGILSIALNETTSGTGNNHYFYSQSGTVGGVHYIPYLNVQTSTIVPLPGAVWLLGSGLIGLVAIRRGMRK